MKTGKNGKRAKKANSDFRDFKTRWEAIQAADEFSKNNADPQLRFWGCRTPEDIRWWIMFNMILSLSETLQTSLEDEYLRRIQQNHFNSTLM